MVSTSVQNDCICTRAVDHYVDVGISLAVVVFLF